MKWRWLIWNRLPWEDMKADTREEKHAKIGKMKSSMCPQVLAADPSNACVSHPFCADVSKLWI